MVSDDMHASDSQRERWRCDRNSIQSTSVMTFRTCGKWRAERLRAIAELFRELCCLRIRLHSEKRRCRSFPTERTCAF
jgi:hypothetical protein